LATRAPSQGRRNAPSPPAIETLDGGARRRTKSLHAIDGEPCISRYTKHMSTTTERSRSKLFRRAAEKPAHEINERDMQLLRHIRRHRLIASDDLALLDGGSPQNVLRALRTLFDLGLVERPEAQKAHWFGTGQRTMIYGLSSKGVRLLHASEDAEDLSEKNRRAGSIFIQHTAEIAAFMARAEVACAGREDVSLLTTAEIIDAAPEVTRTAREPLRMRGMTVERGRKLAGSVIPDGLFGLVFPDETASYFMLEIDRGTMPVVRRGKDRTSFAHKISLYLDIWKGKVHTSQFGFQAMRVLTVTPSRKRVETMVDAVHQLTAGKGSGLFLFTDRETLGASNPLDVEWLTGKGETVRLLV
jgi:hypothetical protein